LFNKIIDKLKSSTWYALAIILIFLIAGPEIYISLELISLMELMGASTFVIAYFSGIRAYLKKLSIKFKQVFMLIAILLALPFAFELILFMEIAGIEVAYSCLMIMLAPAINFFNQAVQKTRAFITFTSLIIKQHPVMQTRIYISHVLMCSTLFVLSSSLLISSSVWLPMFILGNKIS